jgi:glutaredoxin
MRRVFGIVCAVALGAAALVSSNEGMARPARGNGPIPALDAQPTVAVFTATWCSACKTLERELRTRGVPFHTIDIDQNPRAYEAAKEATGKSVVPISRVTRSREDVVWIVGTDADGVEKAYRGD